MRLCGGVHGGLDFDRLARASATLIERCDSEGLLEEAWISCQTADWRTEFLSPGTCRIPGEAFGESLRWRVAQWRWEAAGGHEARWVLRAHGPMNALGVVRLVPPPMHDWIAKATADGLEVCRSLAERGALRFTEDHRRLSVELAALRDRVG